MEKILTAAQRLIVAADFKPTGSGKRDSVRQKVMQLASSLQGTGVILKVNSALRAEGYSLIGDIHDQDLNVFADLKLYDISETVSIDAELLNEWRPELLTVGPCGVPSMRALRAALSDYTELLGVTALTSLTDDDTKAMFMCSARTAVLRLARLGKEAGVDGQISSAKEARLLRKEFGEFVTLNTPAIRPEWAIVPGDDQNPKRIMTPAKAIKAGADRIVIGRPITQAENPRDAVMRTLEEIEGALA